MNLLLGLVPVGIAVALCVGLHRLNRGRGWFRIGELIFWDAIILVIVYLIWLRWF
ncbi:MAG: hypothetical protein OER43_19965 [Gammaproteobacteria bacterium]|nr:hypothetical protein [Gammaproteobacteria bacterium]MDH3413708.1 hypothetical protein [Gammaproteobacteria bacterium]